MQRSHARRPSMLRTIVLAVLVTPGCYAGLDDVAAQDGGELDVEPIGNATCEPTMRVFPVVGAHNIGYDDSCANGCPVSCPDEHANSDWNPALTHNGIDIFAHEGAELVAVADGEVVGVGTVSATSGIRVKIRDACGWSYYYGHLQAATVTLGQHVDAGDRIGFMGHTGAASTHLHFNVSPDGYLDDIDPFDLLVETSPTACGADPGGDSGLPEPDPSGGDLPPDVPEPEPDSGSEPEPTAPEGGCGVMSPGDALGPDEALVSCDGRFAVVLQTDGNVVLYTVGTPTALWNSQTAGSNGSVFVMQEDGNLVLYTQDGVAVWHTVTHGNPGSHLAMQDDGNLVVYAGDQPLWWSGTGGH